MLKKILSLALIIVFSLIPITALASVEEKIENTYTNAITLATGQKVEVGGKQTDPTSDNNHHYYNCDVKYKFTIDTTSVVKFTLSTEAPPPNPPEQDRGRFSVSRKRETENRPLSCRNHEVTKLQFLY